MNRAAVAEQVLSMTTTPARAAAIAGDLAEETAQRGLVWFWLSLLKIATAFVWQSWRCEPWRMARLGAGACILNNLVYFTLFAGVGLASTIEFVWISPSVMASIVSFGSLWSVAASQALTGRWLARCAPRRELPACVTFLSIDAVFWTSVAVALLRLGAPGVNLDDIVQFQLMNLAASGLVFIGINRAHEVARRSRPCNRHAV